MNLIIFVPMGNFAHDMIVPDQTSKLPKKEQVALMFDQIAPKYDFLNRFLSAGIDIRWRKKALSLLKPKQPKIILDVATGTADLAIMASKMLQPQKIIGIDISEGMLSFGRQKIAAENLSATIELQKGDSESIQFPDETFDAVTVSFGVRNFQNLEKGIGDIFRVLKKNGTLIVLEFSKPKLPVIKQLYSLYMNVVTPGMGGLFSRNRKAYSYLNESVDKFPEGKSFESVLKSVNFTNTKIIPLTFGICTIYTAQK